MVRTGAGSMSLSQKLNWMETTYSRIRSPRKFKTAISRMQESSWQRDFAASVLRAALIEGTASPLFELGIPKGKTPFREALRRVQNSVDTPRHDTRDLREWLMSVARQEDAKCLGEVSEQVFADLVELIQSKAPFHFDELTWIRRAMADAIFSIALELSLITTRASEILRSQNRYGDIVISALDFQIACRRMPASDERLQSAAHACLETLNECRKLLELVEQDFSDYELDKAGAMMGRMENLLMILSLTDLSKLPALLRQLMISLVNGAVSDRNFGAFFKKQSARVSHDLAERMGVVGEHYIARTTKDYFSMIRRAGGGGLITAGTIVAKFAMASMGSNLFLGGALASLNYVASFLLMQLFGFRLATKQPSLTASTLVNRLKKVQFQFHKPQNTPKLLSELADEVASIARSLVAAALGNFGVVILATIVFHFGYRWTMGTNFLTHSTAHHALESLNPFSTLTIPFAVVTGFVLWLSTILASFVENFAIRAGYADRASKGLFGVSSCVFLGVLLALTPTIGAGLGFPLDVRHFTLSTGSLTLGVCSLGLSGAIHAGLLSSLFGILLIGVCNFGVSFVLSLTWSAISRGVRRAHLTQVFGTALRFRGFPVHFFIPSEAASMGSLQRR